MITLSDKMILELYQDVEYYSNLDMKQLIQENLNKDLKKYYKSITQLTPSVRQISTFLEEIIKR